VNRCSNKHNQAHHDTLIILLLLIRHVLQQLLTLSSTLVPYPYTMLKPRCLATFYNRKPLPLAIQ
jgi:hypothetical protein